MKNPLLFCFRKVTILHMLLVVCQSYLQAQPGGIDPNFTIGTGTNDFVESISIQGDGKIIIGGDFISYNGIARNYIARLNTDGSLDTGFNPGTGANSSVYATSIQSDGKIIIGG